LIINLEGDDHAVAIIYGLHHQGMKSPHAGNPVQYAALVLSAQLSIHWAIQLYRLRPASIFQQTGGKYPFVGST